MIPGLMIRLLFNIKDLICRAVMACNPDLNFFLIIQSNQRG